MAPNDYLVLASDGSLSLDRLEARIRPRLSAGGWSRRVHRPLLRVYVGSHSQLNVTESRDGHGVCLGEVFARSSLKLLDQSARSDLTAHVLTPAVCESTVREVWGGYVLVRTGQDEAVALRDPSGAIECVAWRLGEVSIFASAATAPLEALFPHSTRLDIEALAQISAAPGEFHHRLALTGLTPVVAGGRLRLRPTGHDHTLAWSPSNIYRRRPGRPSDAVVRETIVETVRALVGDRSWIGELSGGLDSAVVAASLSPQQQKRVLAWVNHATLRREGDERSYAWAVADRLGCELTEWVRTDLPLDLTALKEAGAAFRPPINDFDPGYNQDIHDRIEATGAAGSLTGQGGDAVFFQMATPMIGLDELSERGLRSRLKVLHRVARWTKRSLWPQTWWREALVSKHARCTWTHPWTNDLEGLPPAKAFQVNALAYSQVFQQTARRSRRGICLNPLLSQPLMELGLSLSTTDLTWGGRDRALIRRAFANDLPQAVIDRRSKGDVGAFYGLGLRPHLHALRAYLLDGALVDAGALPRSQLETLLTEERLLWQGDYGRVLSLLWTEIWLRYWRSRLASPRLGP